MAAEAATLQLIWYQIQQETVYYIMEMDPFICTFGLDSQIEST